MEALTREEWSALWAEIDPKTVGAAMPLNEYARLCDTVKREWKENIQQLAGNARTDNARYVVHVEDCLSRGIPVPHKTIMGIDLEVEAKYDSFAFPILSREQRTRGEV